MMSGIFSSLAQWIYRNLTLIIQITIYAKFLTSCCYLKNKILNQMGLITVFLLNQWQGYSVSMKIGNLCKEIFFNIILRPIYNDTIAIKQKKNFLLKLMNVLVSSSSRQRRPRRKLSNALSYTSYTIAIVYPCKITAFWNLQPPS